MVLLRYLRNSLKPEIYGPGYRGMLKQGFYEAPYITIACLGLPLSFWPLPIVYYKYNKLGGDYRRYMRRYTVYRPNDPMVKEYYSYIDRTTDGKLVRNKIDNYFRT